MPISELATLLFFILTTFYLLTTIYLFREKVSSNDNIIFWNKTRIHGHHRVHPAHEITEIILYAITLLVKGLEKLRFLMFLKEVSYAIYSIHTHLKKIYSNIF